MNTTILNLLSSSGPLAIFVSILINILFSIAGVIPSIFITAANITFFGFEIGLIISYIGESIGAAVSFLLYRKGIKIIPPSILNKNKWLLKLQKTQGRDAFFVILMLRILPFVPSGMINLAAAASKTSLFTFIFASSLGKLPALIIEALTVQQVLKSSNYEKSWLVILSLLVFAIYILRKRMGQKGKKN